jgi:dihydroorotate dehydrogenase electron transfer subunit
VKIIKIQEEARDIKTFFFDENFSVQPGRFVSVWIPDYGEKPFSISYENPLGITVRRIEKDSNNPKKGLFTNEMFEKEEGDYAILSGPRGRGFPMQSFNNRKICMVGGGTGIPPLAFLSEKIHGSSVVSFLGAKNINEIMMEDRFEGEIHVTTDDGSYKQKGFCTDCLEKYDLKSLVSERTKVAMCGPERMMSKAARILEKYVPPESIYVTVERLMKCYVGLCGSCEFGGNRVCQDGPVFTYEEIKNKVPDFGNYKRDRCGRKELL